RTADRLDAETRALDEIRRMTAPLEDSRQRAVQSARQATEHVIARLPQAEGVRRSALEALRKTPTEDSGVRLLRHVLDVYESGQRLARSARALWKLAEQFGAIPERLDELERAERRFEELSAEARLALEHRGKDWQPADPDRLARGLQLAREGK